MTEPSINELFWQYCKDTSGFVKICEGHVIHSSRFDVRLRVVDDRAAVARYRRDSPYMGEYLNLKLEAETGHGPATSTSVAPDDLGRLQAAFAFLGYECRRIEENRFLWIRKVKARISPEEWRQAVDSCEDVRLNTELVVIEGPDGQEVPFNSSRLNAEVRYKYGPTVSVADGSTHFWALTFFYQDGKIWFNDFGYSPTDKKCVVALQLAESLDATITLNSGNSAGW